MLTYIENDRKSFEERMAEAVADIPLYTTEWTNFNPSDPGITILETLLGFASLQQDNMNEIPFRVKQNLLKLVGFNIQKGRCARLMLSAGNVQGPVTIPANHRFRIGELVFETNREIKLDKRHLIGIYGMKQDGEEQKYTDFSYLLDREVQVPALIFGERPRPGDCLYFVASRLPEPKEEFTFYVGLKERNNRNPIDGRTRDLFASIAWECYTKKGWLELNVRDNTNAFLNSGEIRMWMPEAAAEICLDAPVGGYCIRARLKQSEYDVLPMLTGVEAFLFETWQKNTICECHSISKTTEIELVSEMAEEAYIDVYCREGKGEPYRKYEFRPGGDDMGRFYELSHEEFGRYKIIFDKKKHGYGPEKIRDCVKVVVYTEEVMRRYALGKVMGYDDQTIKLPYEHLVASYFCILARRVDENGEFIYDFVRPEKNADGDLYYHLLENEGKIIIEEAGRFIGADLFLAAVSLTSGPDGNIREGNTLIPERGLPEGISFYNPGAGTGGAFREKLEDVRRRFLKDMENPYTAVTEADYERLVRTTPGLCVKKARAWMDETRNLVRIAVMQGTDEEHPAMSKMYEKIIRNRLEERRLLTTRVELVQPQYVPVNVYATVYVKLHYDNAAAAIEKVIREKVDYTASDRNFGQILKFDEIFHAIEVLECVEYVYELSLKPGGGSGAKLKDADVLPGNNCLLYPGDIRIETLRFDDDGR